MASRGARFYSFFSENYLPISSHLNINVRFSYLSTWEKSSVLSWRIDKGS